MLLIGQIIMESLKLRDLMMEAHGQPLKKSLIFMKSGTISWSKICQDKLKLLISNTGSLEPTQRLVILVRLDFMV